MNQKIKMVASDVKRNEDLDVVKGGMVCIMFFYHCVSVSNFANLRVITSRIDFIHFSFLLITGFLCGYHYHTGLRDKLSKVQRRLMIRAWKIFIIFLFANIISFAFIPGNKSLSEFSDQTDLIHILLVSVPGEFIAFEVLYLIAAFLLVAAIIIRLQCIKWVLILIVLSVLVIESLPLLFIACGCLGMLIGICAKKGQFTIITSHFDSLSWFPPLLLVMQITFLPPLVNWSIGNEARLFFVTFETMLWSYTFLWLIKSLGNSWIKNQIILLGHYTLPAYIFQMICARIIFVILSKIGLRDFSYYVVSLVFVILLTWFAIIIIERVRKNWSVGDRIYRLMF